MSGRRVLCAAAASVAAVTGCAAVADTAKPVFGDCQTYRSARQAQRAWERADRVCEALAQRAGAQHRPCRRSRRLVIVRLSARRYPYTADHISDAIAGGQPRRLHLDRAGADANREESLQGIPTRDGYDRDEYPPAVAREGGAGADVRYVPSADNRGAGAILGERLERYCDGQPFRLKVVGRRR